MSIRLVGIIILLCFACLESPAQSVIDQTVEGKITKEVERLMEEGDIPGLSLIIINRDETLIKAFGFADVEEQRAVTPKTLFELASCTKAFTGLALLQLEKEGLVDLDKPVSDYLPWLRLQFENSSPSPSLRQLLHHTSGISEETLSLIPEGNQPSSLSATVKELVDTELNYFPGTTFEYATINYDVLGLVIQEKSGMSFEAYVTERVLKPLQMLSSRVGGGSGLPDLAQGYKISFFQPRAYDAPVYKGNNPAGYLISNGEDMARWLKFQMGQYKTGTALDTLLAAAHSRDETIPPSKSSMSSYAAGWEISLNGDGKIYHSGQNPNFSAYMSVVPEDQLGIAVLSNSNSSYTPVIEKHIAAILYGETIKERLPDQKSDKVFSIATIALLIFILSILAYIGLRFYSLIKGRSVFKLMKPKLSFLSLLALPPLALLLYGIYLLPQAMVGFSWEAIRVWAPDSFIGMVYALLTAIGVSFLGYLISTVIIGTNKYFNAALPLLILSLLSGLANTAIIILVTSAVGIDYRDLGYVFFYFIIAFSIYIIGRKIVQTRLIQLTLDLIYDVRSQLITKIFSTTYQEFEKMDRGRVYATLSDDTNIIGNAANVVVSLLTNTVMTIAAFIYLTIISPEASVITILSILIIAVIYFFVTKSTDPLFEKARDIAGRYMGLLNGLVDGFKELSIHAVKRLGYLEEAKFIIDDFRNKLIEARVRFVNAFLVGESLLVAILGLVAFVFPQLFPAMESATILSFIIVMLYLIGPINGILGAVPTIMQMRVSWRRIQGFLQDIPDSIELDGLSDKPLYKGAQVNHMQVKGIRYEYEANFKDETFVLGPVNFELRKGEALFIVGGNGSGKTTLCKILTGLYESHGGEMRIDGKLVGPGEIGEYFSVAFNPAHLFEKLYELDEKEGTEHVASLLETLGLSDKVEIKDGAYSTLNLSQGQRKRLALLQCYLEDRPIYMFDEWAADQDPDYRRFFYKELIPEMKRKGKLIIAITHDDHYFSEADHILKLNQGQQEQLLVDDSVKVS